MLSVASDACALLSPGSAASDLSDRVPESAASGLPDVVVDVKSSEITTDFVTVRERRQSWTREQFSRDVSPVIPGVFRLCLALADSRAAAEDLLQSSLVRAYAHRDSYRGDGSLTAWLCCITRNEHAEHVRQTARRRSLVRAALERFGELFDDWSAEPEHCPDERLAIAEDSDSVLAALRELPEAYRVAVWMCDVEEMSYQAASETLGIPIGTVKSRHARARNKLRVILRERMAREAT
jgi:RNA polymerase sigma-70 factor (ECF subfamily)